MNGLPEHEPSNSESSGEPESEHALPAEPQILDPQPEAAEPGNEWAASRTGDWAAPQAEPPQAHGVGQDYYPPAYAGPAFAEAPMPVRRPPRIPHLGHLLLLLLFFLFGWAGTGLMALLAIHMHLFGVYTLDEAKSSIGFLLGSEAVLYVIAFGIAILAFPAIWHKGFLAGLHWNGAAALRRYRLLLSAAFVCFLLALLSEYLMPGPENAPIDKIFRAPGAAWAMFVFGVTFAPLFEEMIFRGFLLPALSTSFDWIAEQIRHEAPRPLDENGHPQWSFGAMVFAAVCTSIPFALLHAAQTGYSLGPFILLVFVSLVLCWARLSTRSLAASVMIHASYNFMLFTLMMIGTGGFRHLSGM